MRKKPILLALALLMAIMPFAAFSQTLGLPADDTVLNPAPIFDGLVEFSLTSNASLGVFRNALGAAASVDETGFGPRFSELESNYLFGGLANLALVPAVDVNTPFFVGYYSAGDMPWSAFLRSDLADPAAILNTAVATTVVAKPVDANSYDWVDNKAVTEYDNVIFGSADNRAQFLVSLAGMNTGLYLRNLVNNAGYNAAANFVETDEFFYDTAAANVVPNPQLDYRIVTEGSDMGGRETAWELAAPLFLRTGDMSHYARVGLSLAIADFSNASSETHSVPADSGTIPGFAAGEFSDSASEETDKDVTTGLGAKYTLTLPGMLVPGENNELAVSANLSGTLYGRNRSASTYDEDFTFVVGGAATTVAGTNVQSTDEYTYGGVMDFGLDVMATHSIFFDLGPAVLGMKPGVGVGFDRAHLAADRTYLSEQVTSDTVDGAADGSTTVIRTMVNPPRKTDTIDVSLMAPVSLEVAPGTLPFGFILGAMPFVAYERAAATTTPMSFTEQTVVRDAAGTVTSDVTGNAASTGTTKTVATGWTAGAIHNIGLYFNVGERVRIDMALNAANLLDFESFTLQTIIALP